MIYFTYILECADGTLYTGITKDLEKRVKQHNGHTAGGAKYTRTRRPVQLRYFEEHPSYGDAIRRERAIKKLPKKHKENLTKKVNHDQNQAAY